MEEDQFKKIIKNIGVNEPDSAFTDNIMKMIESGEELSLHPALFPLLKNELLAEPPFEITNNLMAAIEPKTTKVLEPIISRKIWLIISGIAAAILIVALFNSGYHINHLPKQFYSLHFNLNLSVTTTGITKIAPSVFTYLIPLSILLFIDYFFRTRQNRLTTGK